MSDKNDINILIRAKIDLENSISDIREQLEILEKRLADEGINIKVGIDESSKKKIDESSDDIGDELEKAGDRLGKGISDGISDAEKDMQKFKKMINEVTKDLKKLEQDKAGIVGDYKKGFNESKKEELWYKIQEKGGMTRPVDGDAYRDFYLNDIDKNVRSNNKIFNAKSPYDSSMMANDLRVSERDIMESLQKGAPKFDPAKVQFPTDLIEREAQLNKLLEAYTHAVKGERELLNEIENSNREAGEGIKASKEKSDATDSETESVKRHTEALKDNARQREETNRLISESETQNQKGKTIGTERVEFDRTTGERITTRNAGEESQTTTFKTMHEDIRLAQIELDKFMDNYISKLSSLEDYEGMLSPEKIKEVNDKLTELNLDNFKTDAQDIKNLTKDLEDDLKRAVTEAEKINVDRDGLITKAKEMTIRKVIPEDQANKFSSDVLKADSIESVKVLQKELEELLVVEKKIKKETQDTNKELRERKQIETSKSNLEKQALNMAEQGKITISTYKEIEESIKNVDELADNSKSIEQLSKIRSQMAEINKELSMKKAEKKEGTIIGNLDQNEAVSIESMHKALIKANPELARMALVKSKLNEETGRATLTLQESAKQYREITLEAKEAGGAVSQLAQQTKEATNADKGIGELFRIALQRVPVWIGAMSVFYGSKKALQDMSKTIIEVDTQMVELKRVMDSQTNFDKMLQGSINISKELSRSLTEVNEALTGFARQGFSSSEVLHLTNSAILATNVSALTAEEAMDTLTSAMVQFNIEAEHSISVVDKLNEVDNNFAITTQTISLAIQKAGSTAETFGVTLDELVGNITAIGVATRESGERIGNSLKTIYSRLTSRQSETALRKVGIEIKDLNGQNKTATEIIDELGDKWDKLTATQQQNLGVSVAGRYQLSRFLALFNTYDTSIKATETAMQSAGSAMRENEQYQKSLEARINRLKVAWQEFSLTVGDKVLTDSLAETMRVMTQLLEWSSEFVGELGFLAPTLGIVGLGLTMLYRKSIDVKAGMIANAYATGGLNASMKVLNKTVTTLTTSLARMFAVTAVLMAIGWAVEKVISSYAKHRDQLENANKVNFENIRSLQEQKEGLQTLSDRYEELSKKASRTKQENEEMLKIQKDLVEMYRVSATGLDSQGVAYADNTSKVRERIRAIDEELEKERELNRIRIVASDKKNRKDIAESIKQTEEDFKDVERLQKMLDDFRKNGRLETTPLEDLAGKFDIRGNFAKKIIDALGLTPDEKEMSQNVISYISGLLEKAHVKLNESSEKMSKSLEGRTLQLEQFSQSHIKELRLSGAEISDEMSLFIQGLAGSFALENESYDVAESMLQDAIEKITKSDFDKLMGDQKKALIEFGRSSTQVLNNEIVGLTSGMNDIIDNFISGLGISTKMAKKDLDTLSNLFKNSFTPDLSGLKDLDLSISETFGESVKEARDNLSDLNDALNALEVGEKLSAKTINDLSLKYEELSGKVIQNGDSYTFEKSALENVRAERIEYYKDIIANETKTTNDVRNEVQSRIKAYGIELATIQTLADAEAQASKMKYDPTWMQEVPDDAPENFKALINKARGVIIDQEQSKIDKDAQLLIEWGSNVEKYNLAMADLFDRVNDRKPKKTEIVEMEQIDEFRLAISKLDLQLKESEFRMSKFTSLSKEYRDELQIQIDLSKEKQKLTKDEIQSIENKLDSTNKEMQSLKSLNSLSNNQKKTLNDLTKEYQRLAESIDSTKGSWLDLQSTIDSKKFESVKSIIEETTKSMNELDHQLALSSGRMGLMEESALSYRMELQKQIELNEERRVQTEELAKALRKELESITDAVHRAEIENQLNDLGIAWFTYASGAMNANKQLKDYNKKIADEIVDMYKDVFKQKMDLSLKAIDEEIKALEKAQREKMEKLDEELEGIEKVISAKIRSIDKSREEEDYNKDMQKKTKERDELQEKITIAGLNDSPEGKARVRDLKEQLDKLNEDIENRRLKHSDSARKEELQNELEKERERIKKAKESAEYLVRITIDGQEKASYGKYDVVKEWLEKERLLEEKEWNDKINSERFFNSIREEIIDGHFERVGEDFEEFAGFLKENAELIGKSITENMIDKLDEFNRKVESINISNVIDIMKNNSDRWHTANVAEQQRLAEQNRLMGGTIGATRDSSGVWYNSSGNPLYTTPVSSPDRYEIGSMTKPPTQEDRTLSQMQDNAQRWHTASAQEQQRLASQNLALGKSVGAVRDSAGVWYKDGIRLFHKGGVVGSDSGGSSGKYANLIDALFNNSPNERIVKALVNEVMIPERNIMKNFMPNMSKFSSLISSGNRGNSSGDTYYNIDVDIAEVTGDRRGADTVVGGIIKGVKKMGGKIR